jgi:hypothetical protein
VLFLCYSKRKPSQLATVGAVYDRPYFVD